MPKLNTKPIEAADLSEYLKSDDDFQFELEIFRSCLKGGASSVEHGGTYQDPVTKKDRQFDIRMAVQKEQCLLKLAIECKNLKTNFPLLVSRVPRMAEENFHELVISRPHSRNDPFSNLRRTAETVRATGPGSLFKTGTLVGKSTVQIGRNLAGDIVTGDGEVYEKWAQAVGSSFDLVLGSDRDYETVKSAAAATAIFPILVVANNTLWTTDYSAEGEPLGGPKRSEECEIFLGKTFNGGPMGIDYTASHLFIFTQTKFDGYLDRLIVNDKYWDKIFPLDALKNHMPISAIL